MMNSKRNRRGAGLSLFTVAMLSCGKSPSIPGKEECGNGKCVTGSDLLSAAKTFGNVEHDFVLDASSALKPGRGLERTASGSWRITSASCATPKDSASENAPSDTSDVDFSYIGLAVDSTLVGADVDLLPYFSAGGEASSHTLRLTAIAFVRDRDPEFFSAGPTIRTTGGECSCGTATHFVGAVKYGGMLSYETTVRKADVHASALALFKTRLEANDGSVKQTTMGGLEVKGLAEAGKGTYAAIAFEVKKPVPIAYSTYPIADVCEFAFPAPDVTPAPLDFGAVPGGSAATRLVHIQSRARVDSYVSYKDQNILLPKEGSIDIPVQWAAQNAKQGCHLEQREDALSITPADKALHVNPEQHSVRVTLKALTGAPVAIQRETLDTGEALRPDYAATDKAFTCPQNYVPSACRTENALCGNGKDCTQDGYVIRSERTERGCHFRCNGPKSYIIGKNACRFEAITECAQECPAP
jgi:hypothetical protein